MTKSTTPPTRTTASDSQNPAINRVSRRALLGAAAVMAPTLILPRRVWARPPTKLVVLHTNDTHSRIDPFESGPHRGKGGVARRATLLKRVRAENDAVITLDAGDTFQGTPWFNTFSGEVDLKVMHALGYDATTLGNHDFDAGVDRLVAGLAHAPNLKVLSANYDVDADHALFARMKRTSVVKRGGVKVGLFGLGIAFEGLVNPKLHAGVRYADPRARAHEAVAELRAKGVDVVIAISHLGYMGYRDEPGDLDWPKDIPGVTYVVGGHTHTMLEHPTVVTHKSGWQTHVMQVGHSGLYVGKSEILIDGAGRAEVGRTHPLPVRAA